MNKIFLRGILILLVTSSLVIFYIAWDLYKMKKTENKSFSTISDLAKSNAAYRGGPDGGYYIELEERNISLDEGIPLRLYYLTVMHGFTKELVFQ